MEISKSDWKLTPDRNLPFAGDKGAYMNNFMIIDFHTHTFPENLAGRAIAKLAASSRARNYLDGTADALEASMKEAGVDYSVLLPVATRPGQQEDINRAAVEVNRHSGETGLISFGGIHPENEDYREILRGLSRNGVKGIKIHPVFQRVAIDDLRYLRIIECASENDMIVITHAGYDIGFPGEDFSSVRRIERMLDAVKPRKCVLAHMGGWDCWEEVEERIAGRDVWLDTAFSLLPIEPAPGTVRAPEENPPLSREQFLRMVRRHGADRILFGTDSPWSGQRQMVAAIRDSGLEKKEQEAVLGGNARELLGILQE